MLYLIRGLPGSGKSTLAKSLANPALIFEADDYWKDREFDWALLDEAHKLCRRRTYDALENGYHPVAVSNTFTTEKELAPYIEMAHNLGIPYTVIIVENRHGNSSVHDVPESTMQKMENRFSVKLRQ